MRLRSIYLFGLIFFFPLLMTAQDEEQVDAPDMPYNEDLGKVSYEGIVHVKGQSKKALFKRAKSWFDQYYANPAGVIEQKNAEKGKIEGRHRMQLYQKLEDGTKTPKGRMNYSIYVLLKDGKFKYQLTEFEKHAATPIPIEKLLKENDTETKRHLNQVDQQVKDLIADLKQYMQEGGDSQEKAGEW